MLTGGAFPGMGDGFTIVEIRPQAGEKGVVDDFFVTGRSGSGVQRTIAVAARHAPNITKSDSPTQRLLKTFVLEALRNNESVENGLFGLVLATASIEPSVRELQKLAGIARAAGAAPDFRARVQPGAGHTKEAERKRLIHFDELVAIALKDINPTSMPEDTSWEVLRALSVHEFRLDAEDPTDCIAAVNALRSVVPDRRLELAGALFEKLAFMVGDLAPAAAVVTEGDLRRRLVGTPLSFSPRLPVARRTIEGLQVSARGSVGLKLGPAGPTIPRHRALEALHTFIGQLGAGEAGVITGEPDVGKSALSFELVEPSAADGRASLFLNAQDLPDDVGTFLGLLDASIEDVLGGYRWGEASLLVIDGAEAAIAGRRRVLQNLAASALRLGWSVVLVARSDHALEMKALLSSCLDQSGLATDVAEHLVQGLDERERAAAVTSVPSLERFSIEPRNVWLLERVGLVDLLLRLQAMDSLPDGVFTEHEVFHAIWQSMVLGRGSSALSAEPDYAREAYLLNLARHHLGIQATFHRSDDGRARDSLEADGLIRSRQGIRGQYELPGFSSDLIQDIAVAHLLLKDGWGTLLESDGPRSALRAARVAVEATLSDGDPAYEWPILETALTRVADVHGPRWAEVQFEAALRLCDSELLCVSLLKELVADDGNGLRRLLQIAATSNVAGGSETVRILAPLVAVFECSRQWRDGLTAAATEATDELLQTITLAWLASAMLSTRASIPLRRTLREQLLASDMGRASDFVLSALASLSTDLNDQAADAIRGIGVQRPEKLAAVVESGWCGLALARSNPELLAELAEKYYFMPDPAAGLREFRHHQGAIRHHEFRYKTDGGIRPSADNGPFYSLARTNLFIGICFVNRMLNWEAEHRHAHRDTSPTTARRVNLPLLGEREILGDDGDWLCSVGRSAAPEACASALLAVELVINELIAAERISAEQVVRLLLEECRSMAMLGLVTGILCRMLPRSFDLLEPLLGYVFVWQGETPRFIAERLQNPRERPASPLFWELMFSFVGRAVLAKNEPMLKRLNSLSVKLLEDAGVEFESAQPPDVIQGWASLLNPTSYEVHVLPDGQTEIEYTEPTQLTVRRREYQVEADRGLEETMLSLRYVWGNESLEADESLLSDVGIARGIDSREQEGRSTDIVISVAAAALSAVYRGTVELAESDLAWAVERVLEQASRDSSDDEPSALHADAREADRAAARALPFLLTDPSLFGTGDGQALRLAVERLSTRSGGDVVDVLADGLSTFWCTPCSVRERTCLHAHVWHSLIANLAFSIRSDWQEEPADPTLAEPYAITLSEVPDYQVSATVLVAPMLASWDASRSETCVMDDAKELYETLKTTWRRHIKWLVEVRGGYSDDGEGLRIATRLAEVAIRGETAPMFGLLHWAAGDPGLLMSAVDDLTEALTAASRAGADILTAWLAMSNTVIDDLDSGITLDKSDMGTPYVFGSLLVKPNYPRKTEFTAERRALTLAKWPHPSTFAPLFERWVPYASGMRQSVDAVAIVAEGTSLDWQLGTGLAWLERAIGGSYESLAGRTNAPIWLENLRPDLENQPAELATWLRIVDGLAAYGDPRAHALQRKEEG
ncbi:ATP-binding protein [Cryobacterium frigoriphilum]|uniref:ATP-binding protein n=1 Tax=Cryobacterium frigoriphilum TaxID=1259150 RepID=A0A4R8ZVE9_9MICO|nr:ATP-binding protein [Cryobacterium frigoriphilum]TFD47074.1 ATP-binding protein [Cryobacterium frigoriphilum]